MNEKEWHEANPTAPKDAGSFGRHILFEGFKEVVNVCSRPSFGILKPYRVDGEISLMPARQLIRYRKANNLSLPDYIEKFWPETGWEICWTRKNGWT